MYNFILIKIFVLLKTYFASSIMSYCQKQPIKTLCLSHQGPVILKIKCPKNDQVFDSKQIKRTYIHRFLYILLF